MGVCLVQELLALRLALEEGCGPGPGPPRELSFTKSSQVVRTLRDILVSACASQWEQLRGRGSDEDELQKHGSEGGCPSKMTHTPPPDIPCGLPDLVSIREWRRESVWHWGRGP